MGADLEGVGQISRQTSGLFEKAVKFSKSEVMMILLIHDRFKRFKDLY